jgi:hypothetical protein
MTDDASSMMLHTLFVTEPRLMTKEFYAGPMVFLCEIYFNIIFASTLVSPFGLFLSGTQGTLILHCIHFLVLPRVLQVPSI